MNPIIIIPARMNASRFYGKPLKLINNIPMVIRIMLQAQQIGIARVVVATPDKEIMEVVAQYKGEAVLTSVNCGSGTDRVAEAINIIDPNHTHDIVINLQGDLAVFNNELLEQTLEVLSDNLPDYDIATACTLISDPTQIHNPNTVKAVVSFFPNLSYGKALYFTRSSCPYGAGDLYQHLGIYAYTRAALAKFVAKPRSPLEVRENLEQLRALEIGLNIIVAKVKSTPLEVNTPEDLDNIVTLLTNN